MILNVPNVTCSLKKERLDCNVWLIHSRFNPNSDWLPTQLKRVNNQHLDQRLDWCNSDLSQNALKSEHSQVSHRF